MRQTVNIAAPLFGSKPFDRTDLLLVPTPTTATNSNQEIRKEYYLQKNIKPWLQFSI